jgi:hypothetical protein
MQMGNGLKRQMATFFNDILKDNNVVLHERFVSVGTKGGREKALTMLIDQLSAYNRTIVPPKTANGTAKEFYGGKGAGRDDLAIAIQLNYMAKVAFSGNDEKYGSFH